MVEETKFHMPGCSDGAVHCSVLLAKLDMNHSLHIYPVLLNTEIEKKMVFMRWNWCSIVMNAGLSWFFGSNSYTCAFIVKIDQEFPEFMVIFE